MGLVSTKGASAGLCATNGNGSVKGWGLGGSEACFYFVPVLLHLTRFPMFPATPAPPHRDKKKTTEWQEGGKLAFEASRAYRSRDSFHLHKPIWRAIQSATGSG